MAGGCRGVPPQNLKRERVATSATPPRVGPKTLANPKPTGVGKRGVQGAKPPWQGVVGDVPPETKIRERMVCSCHPATSGTQNPGGPSAHGGGQRGVQGDEAPMAGGCRGVPPQNLKRERVATSATLPRVGPKTLANPKPARVGKRGSRGRSPLAGKAWQNPSEAL
jgi:hypothetical protein